MVFFFNPHTQVSIELPSFDLCGHKIVLSSSPLSNDCMVFALKDSSPNTVAISTCNLKTMKRTTNDYPTPEPEILQNCWLIFSNELLYFKSSRGWLRTFDTRACKWTLHDVCSPRLPRIPGVKWYCRFMAKHREHIFLIYSCCVKEPMIYKLDQKNGKWDETKNLGGVIFFMGTSSAQARVHILGIKANNIYFPEVRFYGQQCRRYSVDDGRYYPNKKYSFPQEKQPLKSIWIDQPASLL